MTAGGRGTIRPAMSEPEPSTTPGAGASDPERPARRQLFRRRPAESEPTVVSPDPSVESTMVMAAPQPTEIITAEEAAREAADAGAKKMFRRRIPETAAAADASPSSAVADDAPAEELGSRGPLERERRNLVDERESQVYHLGGLAFELHRRQLLPDGVMRLRADDVERTDDRIREIDASLDAIETDREDRRQRERERRAAGAKPEPEPAGNCPKCGTAFKPNASFCWNCGTPVSVPEPVADPTPTSVDAP